MNLKTEVEEFGFAFRRSALSLDQLANLLPLFHPASDQIGVRKRGVVYVEPPTEVLANLVALRVHLDDCPASNGALAVVPGSHRRGKLRDSDLTALASEVFTTCVASAGDVLLMKPLLVHRSSAATVPSRRRVLHIVFATEEPGKTVRWKRVFASADMEREKM